VRGIDLTGVTFGRLTVVSEAERVGSGRSTQRRWNCVCACSGQTVVLQTSLRSGTTRSCGCLQRASAAAGLTARNQSRAQSVDVPAYGTVHNRLRREYGPASGYTCVECGAQADDWSYDHTDPLEVTGLDHGHLRPYSLEPGHYEPRCRSCHKIFDRAQCELRALSAREGTGRQDQPTALARSGRHDA